MNYLRVFTTWIVVFQQSMFSKTDKHYDSILMTAFKYFLRYIYRCVCVYIYIYIYIYTQIELPHSPVSSKNLIAQNDSHLLFCKLFLK
jgi:hypothetical protein